MRSGSGDEPGGKWRDHTGKPNARKKRKRKWIPEADQPRQQPPTRVERPAPPHQEPSPHRESPGHATPPPRSTPRRRPPEDRTTSVPITEARTQRHPRMPGRAEAHGERGGYQAPEWSEDDFERYDAHGYPRQPGESHRSGQGEPRGHGPGEPRGHEPHGNGPHEPRDESGGTRMPRKLTVTRVAALRGRQLSRRAYDAFHRMHGADGADRSGLTQLSWSVMLNYASDAAMAVALANTLFFSPTSAESSRDKIALYLLITIAPFALVAPVIGPALDRVQRGRRLAMSLASAGQALACVVMAANFDTWLLYPAALAKMVLSKSFTVLKSAVTPRVVPPDITLSKTNARLTVFGLAAGGVGGAIAVGVNQLFGSAGALWFTMAICAVGATQAMRIPSWVEVTEGEVPASLREGGRPTLPEGGEKRAKRQPMGRHVAIALWANGTIRLLTGFLMMFAAFAVKDQAAEAPFVQLLLLGLIGGAAGLGGFVGNAIGARLQFGKPDQVMLACVFGSLATTVLAAIVQGVATAAIVGLVGATASALAKISLDAVIQNDLPEESRASAFGRSETVLQLSWVFGGSIGLLLPPTYWIGFLVISTLLLIGGIQTVLVQRGSTMLPKLPKRPSGRDRPTPAYSAQHGRDAGSEGTGRARRGPRSPGPGRGR